MRLESLQRPGGPAVPIAVVTFADDEVVAEGWREVVRLPCHGFGAVVAIGTYRYETQRWRGPRAGYRRRTDEGLVLLNEFGRPLLVIPGHWDGVPVAEACKARRLRVAAHPVSPRSLVAVRRLRLAPRRRMFGYDVVALIAAEIFAREAAELGLFDGVGVFGALMALLASLGGPFAGLELPGSLSGGLGVVATGMFWLSGLVLGAWVVARAFYHVERAEYRAWLRRLARRASAGPVAQPRRAASESEGEVV
ncbi:MAG: hypothetical protein GEV11_16880 [Streptosporangiales bacterium]|nr:hypothetical protein [Streptosporangiales bacterium]